MARNKTVASASSQASGTRGKFMGIAPALAVVVTTSVVPLMEHEPMGIVQLAVSVGGVVNPDSLIGKVNVLPAAPDCCPCGTLNAGLAANVAVAVVLPAREKLQVVNALPLHTPDQLVKEEFALGTAVSVMDVLASNVVPGGVC